MNARERILRTLDHEEPDRVPYAEITLENPNTAKKLGFSKGETVGTRFDSKRILTFLSKIKGFPKLVNSLLPKLIKKPRMLSPLINAVLKDTLKLHIHLGVDLAGIAVGETSYFRWLIPNHYVNEYGMIFEIKNIGGIINRYYVGGLFKDEAIYDAFPKFDPEQPLGCKMYQIVLKSIEKKDIYVVPALLSGFFDSTYLSMGMEPFSRAIFQNPSFIKKMVSYMEKAYLYLISKILDETGIEVFCIGDDLAYNSGPFVSPRMFKKFFLPPYKKVSNLIHKKGAKFLFHSDGNINPLLQIDGFIECFDAIHPWEASANMDIFEAKEKYGDKTCLMGNVPIPLLNHGSKKEISAYVKKLLKFCAPGGGYLFGSGNSITPEIPADNYLTMLLTYRKHRNYPIQI